MLKNTKQRLLEEKQKRDLVQQVAEGHKTIKMVKDRLQIIKQNAGTPLHSTSCELVIVPPTSSPSRLSFLCNLHSERIDEEKPRTQESSIRQIIRGAHEEI